MLVRPRAVSPGDMVAVVSTSWGGAGLLAGRFQRGVQALASLGYKVRVMPHALGTTDGVREWVSGTREERLQDLHAAFEDREAACVLSAIGGDHSAHLLEGINFELIRSNPKVFCGYSDTTTLLQAVHERTDLVTFYGPALLPEFGEIGGPDREVVEQFQRVTGRALPPGPVPSVPWQAVEDRPASDAEARPRARRAGEPRISLRPGRASGRLQVGCLPTSRALIGTPWQPDYIGRVLVAEVPEDPYDVEQADADLAHLRNAGLLAGLAAFVIGRTPGWGEDRIAQLHACVLEAVGGYDFPVLAGVECTHSAPLLTLPIGVLATVVDEELVVEEAAVI
jgi:muramoyltetrapeptide carboxypeptidase LdcA involved in peptidoglycan recycling